MERPAHDPEECLDTEDQYDGLIDDPIHSFAQDDTQFHPYPNKNTFLLGDWYWNHGIQKSKESFQTLLSIVSAPNFNPRDVAETKWSAIDKVIASNDFDDKPCEWEDKDAGWKRIPITIEIPFHNRMKDLGVQWRVIFDLYHWSIISVITAVWRIHGTAVDF